MNPNTIKKSHLALAVAAVLVSAVIGTAHNTTEPFTGSTNMVILTAVEGKGHTPIGQFIGYVIGTDVPKIVLNHKDAKGFKTVKELLKATSTFLGRIKQNDSILLTDNSINLGAMFRDMQNSDVKVPMTSCISRINNVPEVVSTYANGATITQYGLENTIDVAGIDDPIQLSKVMPQVYQRLVTQITDEQNTGHATARSA